MVGEKERKSAMNKNEKLVKRVVLKQCVSSAVTLLVTEISAINTRTGKQVSHELD